MDPDSRRIKRRKSDAILGIHNQANGRSGACVHRKKKNRAEQQSGERSKAAVPGPPVPWLRFRLTDAKFHLLILQSDARVAM